MMDLDKTENEGERGTNAIVAGLMVIPVPIFTKKLPVGAKSFKEAVQTSLQ